MWGQEKGQVTVPGRWAMSPALLLSPGQQELWVGDNPARSLGESCKGPAEPTQPVIESSVLGSAPAVPRGNPHLSASAMAKILHTICTGRMYRNENA